MNVRVLILCILYISVLFTLRIHVFKYFHISDVDHQLLSSVFGQVNYNRDNIIWIHRKFNNMEIVRTQKDGAFEQYLDVGAPDYVEMAGTRLLNIVNRLKSEIPQENILEYEVGLDVEKGISLKVTEHVEYLSRMGKEYDNLVMKLLPRVLLEKMKYDEIRIHNSAKGRIRDYDIRYIR